MPSPILIYKFYLTLKGAAQRAGEEGRFGKMIKRVRVLFTLQRSEFRWPKPCSHLEGEQGQPHRVTSQTATCCQTGVTAPGFISKVPVRLSRVHWGSPEAAYGGFLHLPRQTHGFPCSKCICSFISPPFPFPLLLAQSSARKVPMAHPSPGSTEPSITPRPR